MSSSRSTNKPQAGLTLIEVLVVIAIASIIAMFGTPIYQGYQLKTKVGSSIVSSVPVQRLVTEYYILNENWPGLILIAFQSLVEFQITNQKQIPVLSGIIISLFQVQSLIN